MVRKSPHYKNTPIAFITIFSFSNAYVIPQVAEIAQRGARPCQANFPMLVCFGLLPNL